MPRSRAVGDKPKGRMYGYAFFVQIVREEHRKRKPDESVDFKDFSRSCAAQWKMMSQFEKKRFNDMAERDKIRYETEMLEYVPPQNDGYRRVVGGGKGSRRKDPYAPKLPVSAFIRFCSDERPKIRAANPDLSICDVAKVLGRLWADVNPALKAKYVSITDQDKARYKREIAAYKQGGYTPQNAGYNKGGGHGGHGGHGGGGGKRFRQKRDPNAPKLPLSAFIWYSSDERPRIKAANPDFRIGDVAKVLGRLWSNAHPDLKAKYVAMSGRDKQRYQREMAIYKQGL